jgi:hypothetical protein
MLKADVISQAYAQIRISGLTTQEVPEEVEIAIRELDQMMEQWASMGRNLGYTFPIPDTEYTRTQSNPNDNLGTPPWSYGGIISNLAKNVLEYFGKPLPPEIAGKARFGLNVIKQRTFKSNDVPYPSRMPVGSGQGRYADAGFYRFYWPTYQGRAEKTQIVVDQNLDLTADFTPDLINGDLVASYTIEAVEQGGVTVVSSSLTGNVVSYRVLANRDRDGKVNIVATTDQDLVLPRAYCFKTTENVCVVTYA